MIRTLNLSADNDRGAAGFRWTPPLVLKHLYSLYLVPFCAAIGLLACGGPKEAENPRTLLGDDLTHEGVYGGGTAPDTPGAEPDAPASARGEDAAARREDCAAAAAHLVALGVDLAIREETDPGKKRQLAADKSAALNSERAREHREAWTRECLQRGTTVREARCIARIRSEADIDACVGGP
jgi:hypothetical protein